MVADHIGSDSGAVAYHHTAAVAGNLLENTGWTNTYYLVAIADVVVALEEESHADFEVPALRMPPCQQFREYPRVQPEFDSVVAADIGSWRAVAAAVA